MGCPPEPRVHINNSPISPIILYFPERRNLPGFLIVSPHPNPYCLSPKSCLNPPLPIPPPAKLPSLLLSSFLLNTAKHSVPICQHPPLPSLPELEDDASGHKNNDDGDGNCDIELGVHT